MSETETLFAGLRQSADGKIVDLLERMVREAPDHALNKINALEVAKREGVDEEQVIATLLNAVSVGLFEMTWNVMCPSCAGVLSANKSLKTLDRKQYKCAFCAAGYGLSRHDQARGRIMPIARYEHGRATFRASGTIRRRVFALPSFV